MVRVSVLVRDCIPLRVPFLANPLISLHRTTAWQVILHTQTYLFPELRPLQNNIVNAERRGKRQVLIRPSSKVVVKFLSVMQRHGTYSLSVLLAPLFSAAAVVDQRTELGVITAIDVVVPPPISRFNAPKHECLSSNQTAHFLLIMDLGSQKRQHTSSFIVSWWLFVTNADTTPLLAGYIGDFDIIDDHRSGKIVVQLNGRLNKTGVISPRFNVQVTQIESWVNLLLPARSFGKLILVGGPRLILLGMLMTCV